MNFMFTPEQATHAQQVAMELFKKRFFLPKGVSTEEPLPYLSPKIFVELYKLDKMFDDKYHFTARKAEAKLRKLELNFGLEAPKLSDSKQVVTCSRYGSGLEIVAIVPLMAMVTNPPGAEFEVCERLFGLGKHSYPIKTGFRSLEQYCRDCNNEFSELQSRPDFEDKSFVVLGTRFKPNLIIEPNVAEEKLKGLVTFPDITSYLLYRYLNNNHRLTKHAFTIFRPAPSYKHAHIEVSGKEDDVALRLNAIPVYSSHVAFATIL